MRFLRKNPSDENLQNLERLAQLGDIQARDQLFLEQAQISPKAAYQLYVSSLYNGLTIVCPFKFSERDLQDFLITAFEGRIGYWAGISDYVYPLGLTSKDFAEGNIFNPSANYMPRYSRVPLIPGGAVILYVNEDIKEQYRLDRQALEKGLVLMAKEAPDAFLQLVKGEYDASTADLLIQYSIFGEIVYR